MTSDVFWNFFAMPIGLMICFGPVVIGWLLSGPNRPAEDDRDSGPERPA